MTNYVDINLSSLPNRIATPGSIRGTAIAAAGYTAAWGSAVVIAAASGALASLYRPLIGAIVAATIAAPMVWYALSVSFRALIERIGHRRIVMFHIWRIPAALLFFWYGFQGALPTAFWALAGTGDLIAGLYALRLSLRGGGDARSTFSFHRFGFADFVVAVGTGLTFTLLDDPRMAPVAALPLALIPLFGVGISGASHLMAFDMLRRGVGFA
jgi:hypothetical protein